MSTLLNAQSYSRVALNVGISEIRGDVNHSHGNTQGIEIMKHNKLFGLGIWAHQSKNYGQDYCPSREVNVGTLEETFVFHNYETKSQVIGLMASIGQMNYMSKSPKGRILYSLSLGAGLGIYSVSEDLKDANGLEYDYSELELSEASSCASLELLEWSSYLYNSMDYIYETKKLEDELIFNLKPKLMLGYALTKNVAITCNISYVFTRNDELDAQRWTESGSLTRDFDYLSTRGIGIQVMLK